MQEKDWHMLVVLYDLKRITKAAEELYISQPAITHRIKQIEKDFNIKLIIRSTKGIEFTSEGEKLVQYSKRMLIELKKIKDHYQKLDRTVRGTLKIGVSGNFARHKLPQLLREFHDKYPEVEFDVITGWSNVVLDKLLKEEIHLAIIRGDFSWSGAKHILSEEPLYVASKQKIDLDDLPQLNRIRYQTNTDLNQTIENWWKSKYKTPSKVTMEVDTLDACKEMIKQGLGYAILPALTLKDDDPLYKIPLTNDDGKIILRNTWLLYRTNFLELTVVEAFVDFVRNKHKSN